MLLTIPAGLLGCTKSFVRSGWRNFPLSLFRREFLMRSIFGYSCVLSAMIAHPPWPISALFEIGLLLLFVAGLVLIFGDLLFPSAKTSRKQ